MRLQADYSRAVKRLQNRPHLSASFWAVLIGESRKSLAINGGMKTPGLFWKATALPLSYTRAPVKLTRLATAAKFFLGWRGVPCLAFSGHAI